MIEKHPFGDFIPKKTRYLMLGSFVTKPSNPYEWFYANGRNQFWPIMQEVYGLEFSTTDQQQKLFIQLKMALADIILSCERRKNSNLDMNLFNIVYNIQAITAIISKHKIQKIFFTSRHVENLFSKVFKDISQITSKIELICLPSPSPRYAAMSKAEKIARYKALLPKLSYGLKRAWNHTTNMFTVYILRTSSNTLYAGQTNNLEKRLKEHADKGSRAAKYIRSFASFKLVYTETFVTKREALQREAQLKKLTKAQKEALVKS